MIRYEIRLYEICYFGIPLNTKCIVPENGQPFRREIMSSNTKVDRLEASHDSVSVVHNQTSMISSTARIPQFVSALEQALLGLGQSFAPCSPSPAFSEPWALPMNWNLAFARAFLFTNHLLKPCADVIGTLATPRTQLMPT